jgi:hypothetical protein
LCLCGLIADGALEIKRHAFVDQVGEVKRIPVGEPDATVGILTTDGRGLRRPVDAIAAFAQCNPDEANGIVRPRLDL